MKSPLIIRKNSQLKSLYHSLEKGTLVSCILNLKQCEEHIFTDLVDRGITLFPSAISQLATRSKCFQATIFNKWMVPNTFVIRNQRDLAQALYNFQKNQIKKVVTKLDRADCGLGISIWNNPEELFSHITFSSKIPWPFVVQPFIEESIDIRVVWLGDYHLEAYTRHNPYSFRNNIHFGGQSGPYELSESEKQLCKEVMDRGRFPWAHIDLLKSKDGTCYLSEISLFGGLKGASISQVECQNLKLQIQQEFEQTFVKNWNSDT